MEMPNREESDIRFSMSGIPASVSHFVMACRETPSFSANFSWDIPVCLRMVFSLSANVMV